MNVRLDDLEAEAHYARDRYRLYRAQAYGRRLTNPQHFGTSNYVRSSRKAVCATRGRQWQRPRHPAKGRFSLRA